MSRPHSNESVFRAVADGTRRRVIEILLKGERTPVELAQAVRVSQQTMSHHLNVLRTSGVVRQHRRGRSRVYQVVPEPLKGAAAWFRACEATPSRGS